MLSCIETVLKLKIKSKKLIKTSKFFFTFIKLAEVLSNVVSFESFCAINPDDVFTSAPGSSWNYKLWMSQFCSLSIPSLLRELNQTANVFEDIVSIYASVVYLSV